MDPEALPPTPFGKGRLFTDAASALAEISRIYATNTGFLQNQLHLFSAHGSLPAFASAGYPYVAMTIDRVGGTDNRLSYGFLPKPGSYATTLTRPDIYGEYWRHQFDLLLKNHNVPLEVGVSDQPIPIHFAFPEGMPVDDGLTIDRAAQLRDFFHLPDLSRMDDSIANGTWQGSSSAPYPLSLFPAARTDYSLHRLRHYTGTSPAVFQRFVIFTNYQFYVDEFVKLGLAEMAAGSGSGYTSFVEPGGFTTFNADLFGGRAPDGQKSTRLPQMPSYHLTRADGAGITMINIGIGPSNARNITDHIAVLRPHAWIMLGHCAGLRDQQRLGDYVLAHGYVRDDHVLDDELPLQIPIPALAEVQRALQSAVGEVTNLEGFALKAVMRTGTVATVDNRNWELWGFEKLVRRFSQSRAIALDMESATIAANGFRFRVPYGTLLCVSDKPLHGEIKLPGMANRFYREQVDQHLKIGVRAMEILRDYGEEALHSRKLRGFLEPAFQ
jgi:AMP nucleosidase